MALQRHRAEVGKKSKIKKILEDQPLKKEREKIGLTEKEKKKAVNIGKGKKAAKKTKKYIKELGKEVKRGFVDTLKLSLEGAKEINKRTNVIDQKVTGFTKEMLGLKKGGPVDARKIAKKYFKGTF